MAKMYFITEEWNESDHLPYGMRTSHVDALCLCLKRTSKWRVSLWKGIRLSTISTA